MKKILYTIVALFHFSMTAQDPELFEHVWILSELSLGGNVTTPSDPIHIGELTFEEIENILSVTNVECDKVFNGDFTSFNNTTFELFDFVDPFGFDCNNGTAFDFLEIHSFFYKSDPTEDPLNPFNYEITTSGDEVTLIITNGNGDIATYGNFTLSLQENALSQLKLLYNPENELVSFIGQQQEITVTIYNLAGQKQLESRVTNQQTLYLDKISKGVYFAVVTNQDNQKVTKKFMKY